MCHPLSASAPSLLIRSRFFLVVEERLCLFILIKIWEAHWLVIPLRNFNVLMRCKSQASGLFMDGLCSFAFYQMVLVTPLASLTYPQRNNLEEVKQILKETLLDENNKQELSCTPSPSGINSDEYVSMTNAKPTSAKATTRARGLNLIEASQSLRGLIQQ